MVSIILCILQMLQVQAPFFNGLCCIVKHFLFVYFESIVLFARLFNLFSEFIEKFSIVEVFFIIIIYFIEFIVKYIIFTYIFIACKT